MDDGGEHGSGRHRLDYYRGVPTQWNMIPQNQNQNQNAYLMNKKIMDIFAERDAAIEERNRALSEKNAALDERDAAIQQRDIAMDERDNALRERDNAIAALHFHEYSTNATLSSGVQRGTKRKHHHHPTNNHANDSELTCNGSDARINDAFPPSAILAEAAKSHPSKRTKENKDVSSKTSKQQRKGNKVGEDLNRHATTDESKAERDAQDLLNQIDFGESAMPVPVCSCTGVPRQCYKWGDGGWQSSCCTTTMSVYPLPHMPNKRHARMGGRKMSGNVFTRLISRLASDGRDLSMPLDLKNYWAKHGTNRYITLK